MISYLYDLHLFSSHCRGFTFPRLRVTLILDVVAAVSSGWKQGLGSPDQEF